MTSKQSTGKIAVRALLLLFSLPALTAGVQPLTQPKIHAPALGSAIRFWCAATASSIWYSEAGPASAKYAPGGYNVSIWSNALHTPQNGRKMADCGYSPALPLLDSRRKILWFSRRTADTNGDGLIDQQDGLVLVRFDLAHNQSKTVTDTDEIAWPLALDARTGRILAVVDGQYVILSSEDGDVIERLAPFVSRLASSSRPFFDMHGRPWLFREQGPPLSIVRKTLEPGHPVVLSCRKSGISIQAVFSNAMLSFRLTHPTQPALLVPATHSLWPLSIVDNARIIWLDRHRVFAANHLHRQHEQILLFPSNLTALYPDPAEPGTIAWLHGDKTGYSSIGAAHWAQERSSGLK